MEMKAKRQEGLLRGGWPLQIKVSALVVLALVSLAVATGLSNYLYFRTVLNKEMVARGKAISGTLASALVEMPDSALGATISSVKKEANLAYVEVVNPRGSVIAHTFEGRAPAQDAAALRETEKIQEVKLEGVKYIDVPAPVITGAVVHVGLDPAEGNAMALQAQKLLVAITLAALVLAALVSLALVARFVAPLRTLTLATRRIVDGDLTQRIEVATRDEVGELAAGFGQMVEKMKEVLKALQESVQLLTEAGGELGQSTSDQSQTITRQATALQETQVTAQEIKQTSLLAAQKAETVLKLTEKADQVSSQGEAAIEQSLGGLTDIRSQVDEIAQKINQLSERTQQIGGITQTVKDLADQSNMLALNAAIEAVRSGEHGKGFAVVAREIRSLADQSIQATNRVREILEDIGGAIQVAVNITERGSQKIDGGLAQVKQSGENLRELSNIVKDNSSAVRQIAAAVSQQNAGITQIFSAVTDQTRMMDETMKRLETTTAAAATLKDLSARVSEVVGRFRV
ncbi:MAG TPA: methyl-accepting chemotaxis protein [Myxococcales bacterium]|nr:methyl-accepting chemotaxis protein [Myxococcales bacterium]